MTRRTAMGALAGAAAVPAFAAYTPTAENLKARDWFQNARFGLFVHWGVYSVLGDGEWVLNNRKLTLTEYDKVAAQFNPTQFDPAEWVGLVKQAGMRYITITSKHHDGFAMFHTKQSPWNVVDSTPYKKDILKMLAAECQRQGVKLFFYHSHVDWHHPDYFPLGRTGQNTGRAPGGTWSKYIDYLNAQLRELLTGYGEIGGIWFDGWWDRPTADWQLEKTYQLIHQLQPACLVGNNHHLKPFDGEDFQMFEKDLPGQNTAGFNANSEIGQLPLETCDTINRAWGYNSTDTRYKSVKELVHFLVRGAGFGANFLLNVGPMPTGKIQPEFVERLKGMGEWLAKNGETIYGAKGGPYRPRTWGAITQTASKVYVHVLDWADELLAIPDVGNVRNARLFAGGQTVPMNRTEGGLVLRLPKTGRDPIDTIVALDKA